MSFNGKYRTEKPFTCRKKNTVELVCNDHGCCNEFTVVTNEYNSTF